MTAWVEVPDSDGRYLVSDEGVVWSAWKRAPMRAHVNEARGGYLQVVIRCGGRMTSWAIHRLVLAAFVGPRPDGCTIEFLDGDTQNVRLGNLRYAPREDAISRAVRALPSTDCVRWSGSIGPEGYPHSVTHGSGRAKPMRIVYEATVGPIPDGMQLDHVCHTTDLACEGGRECVHRACVNPAHLEPVTAQENRLRATDMRSGLCTRGHDDWVTRTRGGRYCKSCRRLLRAVAA